MESNIKRREPIYMTEKNRTKFRPFKFWGFGMSELCQWCLSLWTVYHQNLFKINKIFPKFSVLLTTLPSSNFFLRKYFLDRKKVLKSLEANSFISPQNYVIRPG